VFIHQPSFSVELIWPNLIQVERGRASNRRPVLGTRHATRTARFGAWVSLRLGVKLANVDAFSPEVENTYGLLQLVIETTGCQGPSGGP